MAPSVGLCCGRRCVPFCGLFRAGCAPPRLPAAMSSPSPSLQRANFDAVKSRVRRASIAAEALAGERVRDAAVKHAKASSARRASQVAYEVSAQAIASLALGGVTADDIAAMEAAEAAEQAAAEAAVAAQMQARRATLEARKARRRSTLMGLIPVQELVDPAQSAAACVIQRYARGFLGRKRYDELRRATRQKRRKAVQRIERRYAAERMRRCARAMRLHVREVSGAVTTCASHYRAKMVRRNFLRARATRNAAALRIQQAWRDFDEAAAARRAAEASRRAAAATCVQKHWRAFVLRSCYREAKRLGVLREWAALLIQRRWRSLATRAQLHRVLHDATIEHKRVRGREKGAFLIQRVWRGHTTRACFVACRRRDSHMVRLWAARARRMQLEDGYGAVAALRAMRAIATEWDAASRIQAFYRGIRARRGMKGFVEEIARCAQVDKILEALVVEVVEEEEREEQSARVAGLSVLNEVVAEMAEEVGQEVEQEFKTALALLRKRGVRFATDWLHTHWGRPGWLALLVSSKPWAMDHLGTKGGGFVTASDGYVNRVAETEETWREPSQEHSWSAGAFHRPAAVAGGKRFLTTALRPPPPVSRPQGGRADDARRATTAREAARRQVTAATRARPLTARAALQSETSSRVRRSGGFSLSRKAPRGVQEVGRSRSKSVDERPATIGTIRRPPTAGATGSGAAAARTRRLPLFQPRPRPRGVRKQVLPALCSSNTRRPHSAFVGESSLQWTAGAKPPRPPLAQHLAKTLPAQPTATKPGTASRGATKKDGVWRGWLTGFGDIGASLNDVTATASAASQTAPRAHLNRRFGYVQYA